MLSLALAPDKGVPVSTGVVRVTNGSWNAHTLAIKKRMAGD
jgi:hypothetical protein